RLCGSSLDAAFHGSYSIGAGDNNLVITGGTESMSRAPYVVPKPERAYPAGNSQMASTTLGWRLVNPNMPKEWTVSLGEATEDRKSTRLNSSHVSISYAVFCLKK